MRPFRMAATIALGTMLVMLCDKIVLGASGNQRVLSQAPACMNPGTSPIVTLHVSGTLHFVEVYPYSMAPSGSDSQATADFDRYGRSDIVIAEVLRPTLTGRLVLLHNFDNWQFAPAILITYPIDGSYLYHVKAADFNQDYWPDRVLREISSTVPGFLVPLARSSTRGVIMPG